MSTFTTPEPITATLTTAGAHIRVTASERSDTVVRVAPVNSANKQDVKVAESTGVASWPSGPPSRARRAARSRSPSNCRPVPA
jgi:hypothetical protein